MVALKKAERKGAIMIEFSRRRRLGCFCLLAMIAAMPLLLLTACQSSLIYFPRPYAPQAVVEWSAKTKGVRVDFQTSQGKQRAFLQGNLSSPRNLWLVCGGNGTLSLDWSEWIGEHAPKQDAWLLIDFPGYGDCEGSPNPARIKASLKTVVPIAMDKLGMKQAERLRFFGHSLGCAACLIAASDFNIQKGVIIAPFTSTMEMSRVVTGLPLGFLVTHRFDNAARLRELSHRGLGQVVMIHGQDDEVIPVSMSRSLAAENKDAVRLIEVPGGRHNTIQSDHASLLADALESVGK